MPEPEDIFGELDLPKPKRGEDRQQSDARLALLRGILCGVGTETDGQLFLRTLSKLVDGTSGRKSGPEFFSGDPVTVSAKAVAESARGYNVYVGGSPRYANDKGAISGKKAFCRDGWMVWADCDTDASLDRLEQFPIEPTFLIHSGGQTDSGRPNAHAWWMLDRVQPWEEIERLNALVIRFLGTQEKGNVKDASRVLRLPGTVHQDSGRPVECVFQNGAVPLAAMLEALERGHEGVETGTEESARPEGRSSLAELRASPPSGADSGRSNWLIQVVGHLVHQYSDFELLKGAIQEENKRLDAPLADSELADTVYKSAERYWGKANQAIPESEKAKYRELTLGWALPSMVQRVDLWGLLMTSPCDVYLEDGTRIKFQEVQQTTKAASLCQVLTLRTKGATAGPTQAKQKDLMRWYQVMIQLAHVQVDHDERDEVMEWMQSFLTDADIKTEWAMSETAERYAAAKLLQATKWDPLGATPPVAVRDRETGEILLKTTDLRAFVYRRFGTSIDHTQLKSRVEQAGYGYRVLHAWPAGYGRDERASDSSVKRKVAVYALQGVTP